MLGSPQPLPISRVTETDIWARAGAWAPARTQGARARWPIVCARRGRTASSGGHVARETAAVLTPAVVGLREHVAGYVAAAQAERECHRQEQAPEQRGVRDRHDLWGDLELVEHHEGADRQDQDRDDGADHLSGRGVAHRPRDESTDGARERHRDHEDQYGGQDVR